MKTDVLSFMTQFHMVNEGDTVHVALSGGADSVALLLLLKELEEELAISVKAVHVEHGIRGEESLRDEAFVKELCATHVIPLETHSVDATLFAKENGLGLEEAARKLRYQIFENYPVVALAHHMDDQAETVLFQLARGTGLKGLCGMQPVRMNHNETTKFIRPFLCVTREQIEAFLAELGQEFCTDSTNADTEYSRNKLRCDVIPELEEINAAAVKHIAQMAAKMQDVEDYLQYETLKAYEECLAWEDEVSISKLLKLPKAIRERVVRHIIALKSQSLKDIDSVHIDAVLRLAEGAMAGQQGKSVDLPYGLKAMVSNRRICLWIVKEQPKEEGEDTVLELSQEEVLGLRNSGESIVVKNIELRIVPCTKNDTFFLKNPCTKCIDYDKIKDGFIIRTRQEGDWFTMSSDALRKKVSREMIDEKLPEEERKKILLVVSGNDEGHVYAMLQKGDYPGRVAIDAYVTEKTTFYLEIKERTED